MTAYEKLKVMKVANWLIEQLLDCGDADFADRVLASIGNGEPIDQAEMEYITMAQLVEGGRERMRACHNCLHWDVCSVREDDIACGIYEPKEKRNVKPQTNADRIRSMNDEELAEFLGDWAQRHRERMCDSQGECLAWLQEPAKDGEDDG